MNILSSIGLLFAVLLSKPLYALSTEDTDQVRENRPVSKLKFGEIILDGETIVQAALKWHSFFVEHPRAYYGACLIHAPELELYELGRKIVAAYEDEQQAEAKLKRKNMPINI